MHPHERIIRFLALTLAVGPLAASAAETTPPSAPPDARNENLPALIREAEKGVFFIRVLDAGGKPISMGTGFLVDQKGTLLTSLHVVRPNTAVATSAEVVGVDGKTHAVKGVAASDDSLDLALLQLEAPPEGAVPLALAGAEPPQRGAYVLVLGHPQGFRFVSTDGIVSGVDKTRDLPQSFRDNDCVHTGPDVVWLQTSAAISPGNSGGPMIDSTGKAIGIIQWMGRGPGMSFALHIGPVRGLLERPRLLASVADFARPDAELREIVNKFKTNYPRFLNGLQSGHGMSGPLSNTMPSPPVHPAEASVPKLLALAQANPGTDVEYRALETIMMIAFGRGCPAKVADDVRIASDRLVAAFRDARRMLTLLRNRPVPTLPAALDFLRALADKSSDAEIRVMAAFAVAFGLDTNMAEGAAREEALKSARLAVASSPDVMVGMEPLATVAGRLVEKLTHGSVDCSAPSLVGKDQAGQPFKLADVLGQYVVVAFWSKGGDFFGNTSKTLDEIKKIYAGAPLAVVGVGLRDSNFSSSNSRTKEPGWKFITDGEDEALRKGWHISADPTLILLDPQGVIIGRFNDVPANTMMLGNGNSQFYYSSSAGSGLESGKWSAALKNAMERIPAIAEPQKKLRSLVTSGPWLAPNGWDPTGTGQRTVFFREDGSTNVKWIVNWELRPPAGLHLHLLPRSTGCTEMDVDFETGTAHVKSPAALASRTLELRDFPFTSAPETAAARSARECLLAEEWSWYAGSKPGTQPASMKFRFRPDGTTTSTMLTAWEPTPTGQVRVYLYDGRYWNFHLNLEKKSARSTLADSQIKDHKAFAVGAVYLDSVSLDEEPAVLSLRPEVPKSFSWDYTFQPEPGKRLWDRIDDRTFQEIYPSGKKTLFTIKDQMTVENTSGTLAVIEGGELQVFIPDKNSELMRLKMRADANKPWSFLGVMKEVK